MTKNIVKGVNGKIRPFIQNYQKIDQKWTNFGQKLFGHNGKIWSNILTSHMQRSQNFEH